MNTSSLKRSASTMLVAAAVTLMPAFAPAQNVRTDYDRHADFARLHTFSIYRVHSYDQIEESRLRDDIASSLSRRGWQQVPQGGDVAVTAIGNVRDQREYETFYNGFGPGWGYGGWGGRYGFGGYGGYGGTTTRSFDVPVGTLAIDLYDSSTHQLIFRGLSADKLSKNSDKNVRKDEKAVDKIFDKLPVKRVG